MYVKDEIHDLLNEAQHSVCDLTPDKWAQVSSVHRLWFFLVGQFTYRIVYPRMYLAHAYHAVVLSHTVVSNATEQQNL